MRKNNFVFLLGLIISSLTQAQDCSGLKDQEVVRLDKNEGPLVNGRIQDQDGIGTCYANAASIALKSALPGNPDLSYLQLAFAHAQMEVAPKNKNQNSAYLYTDAGKSSKFLIDGGIVCKAIEAAKDEKIGGVCKRDDVALEKTLFNSKTNASKDKDFAQAKIVEAVSNYYDSIKDKFGIKPGAAEAEIAKQTAAFSAYQEAFNNLISVNQQRFGKENCLRPDKTNVETVFKNAEVRVYSYLKNKYGESSRFSNAIQKVNGKPNPDAPLFFYYLGMGSVYELPVSELKVSTAPMVSSSFETQYLADLSSSKPSKDAMTAFKNMLLKGDKRNAAAVDKIISELSPEDKALLEQDYNRYVKKDFSECMHKDALAYYKSDDGLIKDFEQDICLKNFLPQAKNLQSMAQILDRFNLSNIQNLNAFLTKVPGMNYSQAMRAIVSPDCNDEKKIKIPDNLKCESDNFDFVFELKSKLVNSKKETWDSLAKKIKSEEEQLIRNAELGFANDKAAIEEKYAGKTDSKSLESKKFDLHAAEIKFSRKKANAREVANASVTKKLIGNDEPGFWNEYSKRIKSKFNKDAVSLLKDQKQAVPVSLCTRLFNAPESNSLREGTCAKDSADDKYASVGGYHAVAVIGVRCQKGKLNYLIQNSWGDWDSITNAKNADGSQHFEHEFGKAWMNEDEMMNNTFGYHVVSKQN